MNFIKKLVSFVGVLAVSSVAFSQTEPKECCDGFKINFHEQVSILNFENDTISEYRTNLDVALTERVSIAIGMPIYNDSNTASSPQEIAWQLSNGTFGEGGTGVGDIDVSVKYGRAFNALGLDFDIVAGGKIPLDGQFSSSDVTFFGGVVFGISSNRVNFDQSVKYIIVDDYTYTPYLGGFVDDNIFEAISTLSYDVCKSASLGCMVVQNYSDGQRSVFVGPCVEYAVSDNLHLNGGFGFAVVDDIRFDSANNLVTAGLSFKF
jgi:hypothetical protein